MTIFDIVERRRAKKRRKKKRRRKRALICLMYRTLKSVQRMEKLTERITELSPRGISAEGLARAIQKNDYKWNEMNEEVYGTT